MTDIDPADILNPPDIGEGDQTIQDDADQITLTRGELKALQDSADETRDLKKTLDQLKLESLARQYQPTGGQSGGAAPVVAPPVNREEQNRIFWNDPTANAESIADARVRQTVIPIAKQIAANLGNTAVGQFKMDKMRDSFYGSVADTFDEKVNQLNLEWLGSLTPEQQKSTLKEAWNAAVGQYVEQERVKRPTPKPPANLGGGGGSAQSGKGGKHGRTLQELDRPAYIWAMQNGLSEEDQAELAKEIEEALEAED